MYTVNSKEGSLRLSVVRPQVQRSQEAVRGRLLLRNYTQASLGAHYDYNLRSEQVMGWSLLQLPGWMLCMLQVPAPLQVGASAA
jgi:hypothetical protein